MTAHTLLPLPNRRGPPKTDDEFGNLQAPVRRAANVGLWADVATLKNGSRTHGIGDGITDSQRRGHEHRPEQTRARLIDAAASAFAGRGYAATSVHDICALAGLSVGAFYYHFDDKAGMTLEILQREHAGVMPRIGALDLRRVSFIEETLSEILNGPRTGLYRALREASEIEPRVSELAAVLRRTTLDELVAAIGRAREESARYRLRPRAIAWSFLALTRTALADREDSEQSRARDVAEIVHHAVVARESPSTETF